MVDDIELEAKLTQNKWLKVVSVLGQYRMKLLELTFYLAVATLIFQVQRRESCIADIGQISQQLGCGLAMCKLGMFRWSHYVHGERLLPQFHMCRRWRTRAGGRTRPSMSAARAGRRWCCRLP